MNEKEFQQWVDRLKIDDGPSDEHRRALRERMLTQFEAGDDAHYGDIIPITDQRRTPMKSPYLKIVVAAAVIIAGFAAGRYLLNKPTKPANQANQANKAVATDSGTSQQQQTNEADKAVGTDSGAKQASNEPSKTVAADSGTKQTSSEPNKATATDSGAKQSQVAMAPIPLELPKAMFEGTPENIRVENLRKPLGKPRPPFLAPEGTTNVALHKPVTATDDEPIIGELDMITDGDKEASDGSYVELGPFLQHVTIDLQGEYNIYAVVVWHYHKQARVYFDVICQTSDDPDFTKNVKTLFNNDIDNSAGQGIGTDQHYIETNEGLLINGKGVKGRYVRLYSNGNSSNDLNDYIEVEVYGKPAK